MTAAAGVAALEEDWYYNAHCQMIMDTRAWTAEALEALGFQVLPSMANFVFAQHPALPGEFLYRTLKEKGILVRHFSKDRIADYNRITIGTRDQMEALIEAIAQIRKEQNP